MTPRVGTVAALVVEVVVGIGCTFSPDFPDRAGTAGLDDEMPVPDPLVF